MKAALIAMFVWILTLQVGVWPHKLEDEIRSSLSPGLEGDPAWSNTAENKMTPEKTPQGGEVASGFPRAIVGRFSPEPVKI